MQYDRFCSIISASVEQRRSLPGQAYTSESIYAREIKQIFRQDWVFACPEVLLGRAGDYYAFAIAGEPVVVIRGADGELRAMSNICRHRGTAILDPGTGNSRRLICPYHAWTYDDAGRLVGVPFTGSANIDKENICLPRFNVETWHGLVFVTLDKSVDSLGERLQGVESYMGAYKPDRYQYVMSPSIERWEANWKIVLENAAESYHLFKVHKETLEMVAPTRGAEYIEGNACYAITRGISEATSGLLDWLRSDDIATNEYLLVMMPPGLVLIVAYDSLSWLSIRPVSVTTSEIHAGALSISPAEEDDSSLAFTQAFFAEDKMICERVQSAMQSHYAGGGPLVELEEVLVNFYQYLQARLAGGGQAG